VDWNDLYVSEFEVGLSDCMVKILVHVSLTAVPVSSQYKRSTP